MVDCPQCSNVKMMEQPSDFSVIVIQEFQSMKKNILLMQPLNNWTAS